MQSEHETPERPLGSMIHLKGNWELNRWCEELNLRAEELKEIVKKVGPKYKDIKAYIEKKKAL
jgi:hypothetical protein